MRLSSRSPGSDDAKSRETWRDALQHEHREENNEKIERVKRLEKFFAKVESWRCFRICHAIFVEGKHASH